MPDLWELIEADEPFVNLSGSQSLIVPAAQPDARISPPEENATAHTPPLCSNSLPKIFPVFLSQIITALSLPPLASLSSCGENASERTAKWCPFSGESSGCPEA